MEGHTHYFGAGPAALPDEVKQQAQKDLHQFQNSHVSILELSHRSDEFSEILSQAQSLLRDLYAIPNNYHILFMQGGATGQFDAVPLNILGNAKHATYINTGLWSRKAADLARKYTTIKLIEGLDENDGEIICRQSESWNVSNDTAYVHITPNETVDGIELPEISGFGSPIVADMTSCLLMKDIDVSQYGILYAGAQKTLGIAGLTIVIVRDDLVRQANAVTPDMYRYDIHVKENSIVNTSPVFACYMTKLMLEWVHRNGGVKKMVTLAKERSQMLYQSINKNDLLVNKIAAESRSSINVVFNSADKSIIDSIISQAHQQGLTGLSGHRLVGGVRASMYNGTPMEAVVLLNKIIQNHS